MGRFKFSALVGAALLACAVGRRAGGRLPGALRAAAGRDRRQLVPARRHRDGSAASHRRPRQRAVRDDRLSSSFSIQAISTRRRCFGVGVGYQHSDHMRFDLTGEYRGKAAFCGLDRYDDHRRRRSGHLRRDQRLHGEEVRVDCSWSTATTTSARGTASRRMSARASVCRATPSTISRDVDVDQRRRSRTVQRPRSWNLAWALHAGVGMQVTDNLTLDLGYSYVNLGDAQTRRPDRVRRNQHRSTIR